ncbi:hypothetical protein TPHA_0O00690 [Tetrapisispora phaffii CBS 4417]|uniref:EF-hand domain-containing protein n=1 Tax=Tetrapisispora phaffii (strain ATCC 24235 / CBS 4417 / NBRC 1672 / NRRL Y-8282 / UCD 70-5) TaxID=1071381 RepID=G8C1L0_TETPH|nr:hypothetical protein TPHA_0O00690 [Tetrapisispora phaffii CBS 4417]CCE66038.1 hypothetical protein TPHA_0O00690 [Tetrapisispora phaffii CBS 4417]
MKLSNILLLGSSLVFNIVAADVAANKNPEVNVEVETPPEGLSWEEWHMQHEHQMKEYDPESFFALHDIKKKGYFDDDDILALYGLNRGEVVGKGDGMGEHDSSELIDEENSKRVVTFIKKLLDVDDDSRIAKEEYLAFAKKGHKFPDLGVGVGHHADFELEYELHHWNKFHRDTDPDVKNVHKEDIEHELLHHFHEIEHEEKVQRGASKGTVITDDELESRIDIKNIPKKFKNGFF